MPIVRSSAPGHPGSVRSCSLLVDVAVVAAVLIVWSALIAACATGLVARDSTGHPLVAALIVVTAIAIATMLLGGLRALGFVLLYPLLLLRERRRVITAEAPEGMRVAILSCSANDFDESTLRRSMQQSYPGVQTVVLDDSTDSAVRSRVDAFAAETGARVVRRRDRAGYKAGNLNHFLASGLEHDYYAIVDSDETLPADFVLLALRRFAENPRAGVVQGGHRANRGRSPFADRFGPLFETHVRVTQAARSRFGFSMFMGRGALLSAECIRDAGGFPEVVAEDIAFSLHARSAGYEIVYAPEIVSSEDYPIDYGGFRTQHGKFAQASVEYIGRYGLQIIRSPLRPLEKADLLLEAGAAPVAALLAAAMFALTGVSAVVHEPLALPIWIVVALGLSALMPLLAEFLRRVRSGAGLVRAVAFLCHALALYSSTLGITMASTLRVLFRRRAVFTITPKRAGGSWRTTALPDILAAGLVGALALGLFGTPLPAAAFGGAAAAAALVTILGARGRRAKTAA